MPNVLIINDNNLIESADGVSWALGSNNVVFDEPFADTNYTFDPSQPDGVVREIPNTRTTTGLQVDVSAPTTQGAWIAIGTSDQFRSTTLGTTGTGDDMIQRGTKAVVAGGNTVTFAKAFSDTNYSLGITGKDGLIVSYTNKTINGFTINSPDSGFVDYVAIGT